MPTVTKTYNSVKRIGDVSLNKTDANELELSCRYQYLQGGVVVDDFGIESVYRLEPWADVPTNIKDALAKIDAYMQTAMDEDAGLT